MTATTDSLRIEPYREEDREAVDAFNAALQEHERQYYPELRLGSEMKAYSRWMLGRAARRNGLTLMAKAGDRAIGFICGWIREDDKLLVKADDRTHAYVSDIFVAADWRRRGVAHQLLRRFEAEMAARGCRRIQIGSRGANDSALRCYEDFGFRPYVVIFDKPIA